MFYIWHTLLVLLFIVLAFFMGYKLGKKGTTSSKADKIVFETDKDWVIIDVVELHDYVKKQSSKIIQFEDLLKKLEWNIYISKV